MECPSKEEMRSLIREMDVAIFTMKLALNEDVQHSRCKLTRKRFNKGKETHKQSEKLC